jgi:hypothetical protein
MIVDEQTLIAQNACKNAHKLTIVLQNFNFIDKIGS